MAEHVLAVLAAHDHEMAGRRVLHGDDGQVGDAGVVVAPLRGQQVDDVDPLGRAWRSADVGEMKWTWQSAATQPSPVGPATRIERQGSSGP